MSVRLKWNALPNAFGYRVYRNIFPIGSELAYGIPLAEYFDNVNLDFELEKKSTLLNFKFSFNGEIEVLCDVSMESFSLELETEYNVVIKFKDNIFIKFKLKGYNIL